MVSRGNDTLEDTSERLKLLQDLKKIRFFSIVSEGLKNRDHSTVQAPERGPLAPGGVDFCCAPLLFIPGLPLPVVSGDGGSAVSPRTVPSAGVGSCLDLEKDSRLKMES